MTLSKTAAMAMSSSKNASRAPANGLVTTGKGPTSTAMGQMSKVAAPMGKVFNTPTKGGSC